MTELRASAFFDYLNEREHIRLRKEADVSLVEGQKVWTHDPILSMYKFTNVQRHHDKTSDQLRKMFYNRHYDDDQKSILMNCALFRYFGTWEFAQVIGWQPYDTFDFEGIKKLAKERLKQGERVFTGAYVITNLGISAPKQEVVVDNFLMSLHLNAGAVIKIVNETQSWCEVATFMRTIHGFGGSGFMAKETLLDTTYTGFWDNKCRSIDSSTWDFSFPIDWWFWTPIGPGARRGASRVMGATEAIKMLDRDAENVISELYKCQEMFFEHKFKLCPTDIQFGLCEFDKYERVRLGQGRPRSRYHPK